MTFDYLSGLYTIHGGFGTLGGSTLVLDDTWAQLTPGIWRTAGSSGLLTPWRGYGSTSFDFDAGGNGWTLEYGGTNASEGTAFGSTSYYTNSSGWVDISLWS